MSACSGSDRRRVIAALALLAMAVVAVAPSPAHARHHVAHVKGDIHVGDRQIAIDDSFTFARPPHSLHHGDVRIGDHGIVIDSDDASVVRMFSDIDIDSTDAIDGSVVSLFGNATVRGHVLGDVVAVIGSVRLEPGAVIDGDAVAVGGKLDQPGGATVRGQSVSLTFFPVWPGVPPLRGISLTLLVCWIAALLLGALLALLAPARIRRMAETISERTGASLLLGFFLPPLAVLSAVLLSITLIGIPLAVLLPLVYLAVLWLGAITSSYLLGQRFLGRDAGHGNVFVPTLLGSLTVAVMFGAGAWLAGPSTRLGTLGLVFPVLGLLLATVLAIVGSGAAVLSGFGQHPPQVASVAVPPETPAPPAPPVQPAAPIVTA